MYVMGLLMLLYSAGGTGLDNVFMEREARTCTEKSVHLATHFRINV